MNMDIFSFTYVFFSFSNGLYFSVYKSQMSYLF